MYFLLALQFLTRIPVRIHGTVTEKNMARSMIFYPLVGLLIGAAAALLHLLFARFTAAAIADLAAVVFLVLITGNLHLDGLMDTADGLGSGKSRDRMLEIMRDSRVGSHGVTAGMIVLLSKVILLAQVPPVHKTAVLILFPVFGRWAIVYAATRYRYTRSRGLGTFTAYLGRQELFLASLLTLGIAGYVLWSNVLILAAAALAGTILVCFYLVRKAGGMTGDLFGAINEIIEVLSLFVLALLFKA